MKDKKTNILTKQFKYEDYILILVGIIAIVMGILIYAKVINPDAYSDNNFAIILILMGIMAIVFSVSNLIKKRKYKNSIFYSLMDDYNKNLIREKLEMQKVESEISIEVTKDSVEIMTETKNGTFSLDCYKNNLIYSYISNEENSEVEIIEEHDTLKLSLDELYLKYVCLFNQYKNK